MGAIWYNLPLSVFGCVDRKEFKVKNLRISYKIFLLSFTLIVAFSLTVGFVYLQLKESLYLAKKAEIKHTVEGVWGVIDYYASLSKSGVMTQDQAQAAAKDAVRHTRFDDGNYLWIQDTSPQMVMHPIKPALDGKSLSDFKDPNGKYLFNEMANVAKSKGSGYVSYQWSKPGFEQPVDKISFVQIQKDWQWIVGAGLYLDDIQALINKTLYVAIAVVIGVVLLSVFLTVVVSRGISKPLAKVVGMVTDFEHGRLSTRMNLNQKDEIGSMAASMDSFADSLQHDVIASLVKLSRGDISFDVIPQGSDDEIRGTLKLVIDDMNNIMAQIQMAGEQIAAGSTEVSDSSQSLSQGATESASSLEEISASMHELASQTKSSADGATQASQLAEQARIAAHNGTANMQEMIAAMGDISDSGQDIAKIIKVIDEIAFQTNLLALNAAVEAARAGQHGKGFAVVAEEVRNLAARSAKAASETAEMIEDSVKKAQNGVTIADRTAAGFSEIEESVVKVTDLVKEIEASSHEQAQGIGQVTVGLGQIDQVTQQNTASAEEGAAAAEELSSQAEQLRTMLSRFILRNCGEFKPFAPKNVVASVPPFASPKKQSGASWEDVGNNSTDDNFQITLDDEDFGKF